MSKRVFFLPNVAIMYIGEKEIEFTRSLARPKPIVKNGDVVIMDKRSAYNLVKMFPTLWEYVKGEAVEIETDEELKVKTEELEERVLELESENAELLETVTLLELEEENSETLEDEETLINGIEIKARDEFKKKNDLVEYALSFGIELDTKPTLDVMYETFLKAFVLEDESKE